MTPVPPPRFAQTRPMSVGSAFDAYVKSYLGHTDFDTLFEKQVEVQNRDFAREAGRVCFENYQSSGALADIMLLMQGSEDVQFEFKLESREVVITDDGTQDSSPTGAPAILSVNAPPTGAPAPPTGAPVLLGIPDLVFKVNGISVILDWKVNGYCSNSTTSPRKGYIRLRPGGKSHKDCFETSYHGIAINAAMPINRISDEWAVQLAVYSWLSIGSNGLVAIDQLCGPANNLRIAEFRGLIEQSYQKDLYNEICEIWKTIHSDHIFRELSRSDSQARCEVLDEQGTSFNDMADVTYGDWFAQVTRRGPKW